MGKRELESVRNGVYCLMKEDIRIMDEVVEIDSFLGNMWLLFVTMLHAKCFQESTSFSEYFVCCLMLIVTFLIGSLVIMKLATLYQSLNYALDDGKQEMLLYALFSGKRWMIPSNTEFFSLLSHPAPAGACIIERVYSAWLLGVRS